MYTARLDRQLRIGDWQQDVLEESRVGVVGDEPLLTALYILAAAALGMKHLTVLAPALDQRMAALVHPLNPACKLHHIEGFYTHPDMDIIFSGADLIVDLSHYGLANKLLLQKGYREEIPVLRGFLHGDQRREGLKVFTYFKGREWQELRQLLAPASLPGVGSMDPVLGIIAAGIVLEETARILMGRQISTEIIRYSRPSLRQHRTDMRIAVVGAGALGNFVGLGLALAGFGNITFIDPDLVEVSNLNRQVLFAEAVGSSKAQTLSARLNGLFDIATSAEAGAFTEQSDIDGYDVIFDCVDNFETRIVLSEKCSSRKKLLLSGGTNIDSGQVVVYDPFRTSAPVAVQLGLYDIVTARQQPGDERNGAPCTRQPVPSVIMTNQIIAGFMVDAFRRILNGREVSSIYYEADSQCKIGQGQ